MSSIIFDTWSAERWAREVGDGTAHLPAQARDAIRLIYTEGRSYEEASKLTNIHPTELLIQACIGVRMIQEHLQLRYATIDPPFPRSGTGIPGAPIPRYKAVIAALSSAKA